MRFLLHVFSMLVLANNAHARDVHCAWGGPTAGLLIFADLRANVPSLDESSIEYDQSGTDRRRRDVEIISPESACGVAVDFARECTTEEYENGTTYQWSFRCGDKLRGALALEANGGLFSQRRAKFYCTGPRVAPRLAKRTWWGCR